MDDWIKLFNQKLVPLLEESGIDVESTWVNDEHSQFIWIRSYGDNEDDIEKKEAIFYGTEWWKENVDMVRSHLAHREIIKLLNVDGLLLP